SNDYGIGRVSGYLEHWARLDAEGWATNWFWGGVSSAGFSFGDITVPPGTQRLVVVLTWDEPAASAGASRAVPYDLDLWVDVNADCTGPKGACGEYASTSSIDNVEYVVVNNPPPGTYRLKATPFNAPSFDLPYGMAATIIRGDPTPAMTATLTAPANPVIGDTFDVTATVDSPSYLASGVQIEPTLIPLGVTLLDEKTTRADGQAVSFLGVADALTLGNVVSGLARMATWTFRADTTGPKLFKIRAWSENGGEITATATPEVVPPKPDLVELRLEANPQEPVRAPGGTFSVTDVVANAGAAPPGRLHAPLLPLARSSEERQRHPLARDPPAPRPGSGGQPHRHGHRHHSRDHATQHVLPDRVRRRQERGRGERRDEQLPRLGHGHRDGRAPGSRGRGGHGEPARAGPGAWNHVLGHGHRQECRGRAVGNR